MGAVFAKMDSEKISWNEHILKFDARTREANLKILDTIKDGTIMHLSFVNNEYGGIKYQHWFVTDKTHFIEFGSQSKEIYNAGVKINISSYSDYRVDGEAKTGKMDEEMRSRIKHVLGVSNYSLCLRNCEHVANYIFRGRWISSQMDADGSLMKHFISELMQNHKCMINTFPSSLRPDSVSGQQEEIYSFLESYYKYLNLEYYLDYNEDTYNVLLIGPTGSGKSHLVNVIFNQRICESDVSLRSVTKEICFIRGTGMVYDKEKNANFLRNVFVADTVGLCDTEWDDEKIISLIKGRVSSNLKNIDAVLVVFRADSRALKVQTENIKTILSWLKYDKFSSRFQLIGTHADSINEEKKKQLKTETIETFNLGDHLKEHTRNIIFTSFPEESSLNEVSKDKVKESFANLGLLLTSSENSTRIPVPRNKCNLL